MRTHSTAGMRARSGGAALGALMVASCLVTGCAAVESGHVAKDTLARINGAHDVGAAPPSPVHIHSGLFFGDHYVTQESRLPRALLSTPVKIARPGALPEREVLALISAATGVPMRITDDKARSKGAASAANPATARLIAAVNGHLPGMPGPGSASTASAPLDSPLLDPGSVAPDTMALNMNTTLPHALDLIAANFGQTWIWQDGAVVFSRYMTRVFTIAALPSHTSASMDINGSSGGSGGSSSSGSSAGGTSGASSGSSSGSAGGGSEQTTTEAATDVWKELKAAIEAPLGSDATVVVSPSLGTVTVRGTPHEIDVAARTIAAENARLEQMVRIQIQVLSVDATDSDDYGLDLTMLYRDVSGFQISGGGPNGSYNPGTGDFGVGIVSPPAGSPWQRFAQSQAAIRAMTQAGKATIITTIPVVASNGELTPVRDATRTDYLGHVSGVPVSTAGSNATTVSSTLSPSTIWDGINLQVMPRILPNGRIKLLLWLDINDLKGFTSQSSGGQTIEVPKVDEQKTTDTVTLQSGATLALLGFQKLKATSTNTGVGSQWNFLLGGGISGLKSRQRLLILITPVVWNPPPVEARS